MTALPASFSCLVTFDFSPAGQKAALSQGRSAALRQTVTMNFPMEYLTDPSIIIEKDGQARLFQMVPLPQFDHVPSEADIIACILKAKKKREAEEQAEREFAEKIKTSDEVYHDRYERQTYRHPGHGSGMRRDILLKYVSEDELKVIDQAIRAREKAKEEKEKAEKKERDAEIEMKRKAREAEEERVKAEKLAVAKAWIDAHGSPRLKKLFAGGFSWKAVAKEEWGELNKPQGFNLPTIDATIEDRNCPTEQEIDDLRHWTEVMQTSDSLTKVELAWNVPKDEDEPAYPSLDLHFKTPFDSTIRFEKKYPESED